MRTWLGVVVLVGCANSTSVECDFGLTCPEGTLCDAMHTGCIVQQQLDVCVDKDHRAPCATDDIGEGVCDLGVCLGPNCGDGVRTPAEICDGTEVVDDAACSEFGFYGGSVSCSATCTLDPVTCSGRCGDAMVNGPELCDGTLPEATCVDLNFGAGPLECSDTCGPDTRDCIPFGWRALAFPNDVSAIHGTASNNVWIVGTAGMVQRFDGVAWNAIDIDACTNGDLTEVFVLSETDAIVAAGPAVIRISATGCTYDPIGVTVDALWAASTTDMYAGTINGLWHFTGTAWQFVDDTPSRAIWGRSGSDIYRGDVLETAVLHYNGSTWSDANAEVITSVHAIWGTAQETFVSGACGPGENIACVIRYDGTWEPVLNDRAGFGVGARAGRGAGGSQNSYVVAFNFSNGSVGTILAGDGTGWANLDAPFFDLEATPFLTPDGTLYVAARSDHRVFVFDGTTRLDTATPPTGIANLAVLAPDDAVAAASGELWSWNGSTWELETSGVSDLTRTASGTALVVGTNTGVRERTERGQYTDVSAINGIRVAGQSATDFFVVTISLTTVTHYNGTGTDSLLAQPIRDIVSVTPTLAIAVGDNGFIAHWNGASWTTQTLAMPTTSVFFQLTAASTTDAHALANNALYRYDGAAWMPLALPTTELLYDVYGKAGDLFLATDAGLFHHDGNRWSPVDTGDISPVERLAGHGASVFWIEPSGVDQLVRTRPW